MSFAFFIPHKGGDFTIENNNYIKRSKFLDLRARGYKLLSACIVQEPNIRSLVNLSESIEVVWKTILVDDFREPIYE